MVKSELVNAVAPELLGQRFRKGMTPHAFAADEFWCSVMRKNGIGQDVFKGSASEPVCGKLRALFDDVTSEPMPDHLAGLADRLQSAFERGELSGEKPKR